MRPKLFGMVWRDCVTVTKRGALQELCSKLHFRNEPYLHYLRVFKDSDARYLILQSE